MPLPIRSEEHTSELQSHDNLVCRLLLEKKKRTERPHRMRAEATAVSGLRPHRRARAGGGLPGAGRGPAGPLVVASARLFFFFNDTATTEIYTLSLHDALPI